jgi:hypothetical protein
MPELPSPIWEPAVALARAPFAGIDFSRPGGQLVVLPEEK